jgi:hypothetical protein
MAILDSNEIFFTAFEPKVQNRFIMYVDGIPAYTIKGISSVGFAQKKSYLITLTFTVKLKVEWFGMI